MMGQDIDAQNDREMEQLGRGGAGADKTNNQALVEYGDMQMSYQKQAFRGNGQEKTPLRAGFKTACREAYSPIISSGTLPCRESSMNCADSFNSPLGYFLRNSPKSLMARASSFSSSAMVKAFMKEAR